MRVRAGALEEIEGRTEMACIPKVFSDASKELKESSKNRVATLFYQRAWAVPGLFIVIYLIPVVIVVLIALGILPGCWAS